LRAIFLPHGSIYSIDIPRIDAGNHVKAEGGESVPPRGKGFVFVWMWNRKEAEMALKTCNGMQVRAGFASDLVKDKQKKKKVRREEKKQAEAEEVHDDSGRTIAVDWALSKDRWEEKKDINDETEPDSQDEQASNNDSESSQNFADEQDENDNGEESVIDAAHKETEEDVSDEEKAKARPSLPQPEAGTTLFLRNLPFLATEDELRTL